MPFSRKSMAIEGLHKLFPALLGAIVLSAVSGQAFAADAHIDQDVDAALARLYSHEPVDKKKAR